LIIPGTSLVARVNRVKRIIGTSTRLRWWVGVVPEKREKLVLMSTSTSLMTTRRVGAEAGRKIGLEITTIRVGVNGSLDLWVVGFKPEHTIPLLTCHTVSPSGTKVLSVRY
jgi:hypothetical protein